MTDRVVDDVDAHLLANAFEAMLGDEVTSLDYARAALALGYRLVPSLPEYPPRPRVAAPEDAKPEHTEPTEPAIRSTLTVEAGPTVYDDDHDFQKMLRDACRRGDSFTLYGHAYVPADPAESRSLSLAQVLHLAVDRDPGERIICRDAHWTLHREALDAQPPLWRADCDTHALTGLGYSLGNHPPPDDAAPLHVHAADPAAAPGASDSPCGEGEREKAYGAVSAPPETTTVALCASCGRVPPEPHVVPHSHPGTTRCPTCGSVG